MQSTSSSLFTLLWFGGLAIGAPVLKSNCDAATEQQCLQRPGCRWFKYRVEEGSNCTLCENWFGDQKRVTGCRDWEVSSYCHVQVFQAAQTAYGLDPNRREFKSAINQYEIIQGNGEPGNPQNKRMVCSVWCDFTLPRACFGQARSPQELKGVNYGGRFIPEYYLMLDGTNELFHGISLPNGGTKQFLSLCDVAQAPDAAGRVSAFLNRNIRSEHFERMASLGFNLVRLPLGYWNLITLPEGAAPNAQAGFRWRKLQDIMPAEKYRKWIDAVFTYAERYGLKVMLDLHGAPGGQTGNHPFTGCFQGSHYFFDTAWNRKLAVQTIAEMARICKQHQSSCYGVEMLNEPSGDISREHLREFYSEAIQAARKFLDKNTPLIVMEWPDKLPWWKRQHPYTYATHGVVMFSTHLYYMAGKSGLYLVDQQDARSHFDKDIAGLRDFHLNCNYPLMVSEYGMNDHGRGDENDPFDYNSLANWYVHQFNQFGMGSMVWNFDAASNVAPWGPVAAPRVGTQPIDWPRIFAGGIGALDGARQAGQLEGWLPRFADLFVALGGGTIGLCLVACLRCHGTRKPAPGERELLMGAMPGPGPMSTVHSQSSSRQVRPVFYPSS